MKPIIETAGQYAASTPMGWPWCLVTFDGRSAEGQKDYWVRASALNAAYAARHKYGFIHMQVEGNMCHHTTMGRRRPAWCKVPAVARVLLLGIDGRPCESIMYLDSDAVVTNPSLSIDDYLARARRRGDEALFDDNWLLLFSSDYWFNSDQVRAAILKHRAVATMMYRLLSQRLILLLLLRSHHSPILAHSLCVVVVSARRSRAAFSVDGGTRTLSATI